MKKLLIFTVLLFLVSCNSVIENKEETKKEEVKVVIDQNTAGEEKKEVSLETEKSEVNLTDEQDSELMKLKDRVDNGSLNESIKMYNSLIKQNPDSETFIEGKKNLIRDSKFNEKDVYAKIDKLIIAGDIESARKMFEDLIVKYPDNQGLKAGLKDLDNY